MKSGETAVAIGVGIILSIGAYLVGKYLERHTIAGEKEKRLSRLWKRIKGNPSKLPPVEILVENVSH